MSQVHPIEIKTEEEEEEEEKDRKEDSDGTQQFVSNVHKPHLIHGRNIN